MKSSENQFMYIYEWIDSLPLSRPKKNISRDFSDGGLLAEVIKHYYPKLVDVHNYPPASSSNQKCYNWSTLNSKTLHLPFRQGAQKNRSVIKAARDNRCDHM